MVLLIVQIFFISVSTSLCSADFYNRPASTELEMYRHRAMIVYDRLKAEQCHPPPDTMTRRALVSDRTEVQLELEKDYYEELTDLLVACRKAKLNTFLTTTTKTPTVSTQKPTTTTQPPTTTTQPPTTTTQPPTTTTQQPMTTTLSTSPKGTADCPANYTLNPISNTCLRVVTQRTDWDRAEVACSAAGEALAVFDTHDSVQWLFKFLKDRTTPKEWKQQWMWIGLRYSEGAFRWRGRSNAILQADAESWDSTEPSNAQNTYCGCLHANYGGLHDCECDYTHLNYICEKY